MDLTRFAELKRKLTSEKELALIYEYFLDHFGENPEFMAMGESAVHPYILMVIAQVANHLHPTETVSHVALVNLPEHQLFHGGFSLGGRPGCVLYCEDLRVGMIVVPELPPSIEVRYARFTGVPLGGPPTPSTN